MFGFRPIFCNVCLENRTQNILKEYNILNKHYYAQVLIPTGYVYLRNMFDTLDEILYRTIQRCQMEKFEKK